MEPSSIGLFDPYDGADLGDAEPRATKIFEKVAEFHDNLLGDRVGREINGVGGVHPGRHVLDRDGHLVARHQELAPRPDGSMEDRAGSGSTGICTA